MNLFGTNILITGASRGLGKAIAEECTRQGANLVLCARNADRLERMCSVLRAEAISPDQKVLNVTADVSDPRDVERLVAAATGMFSRIDGVVNNAGVCGPVGVFEGQPWEKWSKTIGVNFFGTALVCRGFLPLFKNNRRGKIVNLSGGGAASPRPNFSAYAASKAAVVSLTETLALECREYGICVNAVAPGVLNTAMLDDILAAGPEAVGAEHERCLTVKRDRPNAQILEAARLISFLLSEESNGITGKLISATWDQWRELPSIISRLTPEAYTLRRVVPQSNLA